jgi:hypothetical protein
MAVFSPFALAWRYRDTLRQWRAIRDAAEEVEEEPVVRVSGARPVSKGVQSSADVEMGLMHADGASAVLLEGT